MANYIKTLYNGSLQTNGIQSQFENSGIYTGIVHGVSDTTGGLQTAIQTAVNANGVTHPYNSAPLRRVTAMQYSANKARVRLEYGWLINYWANLYNFNQPIVELGYMSVLRYRRPTGTGKWYPTMEPVSIVTIRVPVTTTAQVLSSVIDKVDKVNGDSITWAGYAFGTSQMKFDGMIQRARVQNSGTVFDVSYVFRASGLGFYSYTEGASGTQDVATPLYGTAVFGGQFPTS